jgi:hypothetical protein
MGLLQEVMITNLAREIDKICGLFLPNLLQNNLVTKIFYLKVKIFE